MSETIERLADVTVRDGVTVRLTCVRRHSSEPVFELRLCRVPEPPSLAGLQPTAAGFRLGVEAAQRLGAELGQAAARIRIAQNAAEQAS